MYVCIYVCMYVCMYVCLYVLGAVLVRELRVMSKVVNVQRFFRLDNNKYIFLRKDYEW